MKGKPQQSDWKVYSKRVSEWRERYLSKKNREIVALLADETKTPTERFWDAKQKLEDEAHVLRNCLDGHARSQMLWNLSSMQSCGMIEDHDLEEFSEELRSQLPRGS